MSDEAALYAAIMDGLEDVSPKIALRVLRACGREIRDGMTTGASALT